MSNPHTGSPERPSTGQTEQTVMEPYIPFMDGPPHPTGVRQTTVSQLAKPDAMTPEEIDRLVLFSLRTGGSVSAVQLDAVALAAKCFESETAFIVGDATGLGKGRTAVAILRNSWLTRDAGKTGRRALYFSTPQLFATLQRDVAAVFTAEERRHLTVVSLKDLTPLQRREVLQRDHGEVAALFGGEDGGDVALQRREELRRRKVEGAAAGLAGIPRQPGVAQDGDGGAALAQPRGVADDEGRLALETLGGEGDGVELHGADRPAGPQAEKDEAVDLFGRHRVGLGELRHCGLAHAGRVGWPIHKWNVRFHHGLFGLPRARALGAPGMRIAHLSQRTRRKKKDERHSARGPPHLIPSECSGNLDTRDHLS